MIKRIIASQISPPYFRRAFHIIKISMLDFNEFNILEVVSSLTIIAEAFLAMGVLCNNLIRKNNLLTAD